MAPRFWISAGELSGDLHGSHLVRAMLDQCPGASFIGMGGDSMAESGVTTLFRIEELSVMGATEVVAQLPRIVRLLRSIKQKIAEEKPDAIIVIDAPDFHFRIIKAAKKLGIPVYYYISPKIWAWRQGRGQFIKNNVRKVISILPFEVEFYKRFGMDIDYVGNPLVDVVNYSAIEAIQPEKNQIGVLPGSRKREVSSLMPVFGGAARILLQKHPHLRFVCIRASNMPENFIRSFWPKDLPLSVLDSKDRWASMRRCELLFAASGTVTLESAIAGVPTLACYKLSPITYAFGRLLVKVPYMSLANIIIHEAVFPELIQKNCVPEHLAAKALQWLAPENKLAFFSQIQGKLNIVRDSLGKPGAVTRAAKVILNDLG